jgi:serine protease Do
VSIQAYHNSWERLAKGDSWGGERPMLRPYVGAALEDDPEGCRVARIDENSPAFKAGLKVGDMVLTINGQTIEDTDSFRQTVRRAKGGEKLTVGIMRAGMRMSLTVQVEERPGRGRRGP